MRHPSGFTATEISDIPSHLATFTQTRIDRALTSFAGRFDRVKVSLADRRDKSGNITCEIKVRLVPSGIWIIQAFRDRNAYAAIENAADGIARTLGRQLERLKTLQSVPTAA